MLCKVPNFLGKSTIEHKTNNFALAVKEPAQQAFLCGLGAKKEEQEYVKDPAKKWRK